MLLEGAPLPAVAGRLAFPGGRGGARCGHSRFAAARQLLRRHRRPRQPRLSLRLFDTTLATRERRLPHKRSISSAIEARPKVVSF